MLEHSPIPRFLQVFGARRHEALEPFLHEDVTYRMEGFAAIEGRRPVLDYWRRMFETHDTIRMGLERHVRDGNVVIVAQRQVYVAMRRPPLVLDGMAIFELSQEKIRIWDDRLPPDDLPADHAGVWRRLRTARW
jgi:limonene-1,2-epoxide hydrolase